ncbi:hypothetical protein IW140_004627 [Coemansia sp. RSA 1813]|nr:hypothetical protein LPJ74_005224 [Coemansia sp. RSA 1843]KAJ2215549.1 hypothetical protein EV179_002142 [Coemansia sp. RSA 487]KAJ2567202.1 hypothetical protein IW140_004627 [Coemansia sp. RSA 1813]
MSINLDQQITYQLCLGTSLQKSTASGSDGADDLAGSGNEDFGFHLVSRNLPRTTTKICRETLETEPSLRARLFSLPGKDSSSSKGMRPAIFEADAHDQKTVCTYEGDYVNISHTDDDNGAGDSEEIDCVLIYDAENRAFVVERLASNASIKSSSQISVNPSGAPAAGSLALPTNQRGPSKAERKKSKPGPMGGVRREPTIDEAAEEELAKELEGMLDDDSDFDEATVATSGDEGPSRSGSARTQENPDEQLSMELAENLDDELFEEAASDDDEFEEVDNVQLLGDDGTGPDERRNTKSSVADDDEMLFEEIEPFAELGGGSVGNLTGHGSGSAADDDFEFEDVGSPNITSMGANRGGGVDDTLFGDSFTSSPNTFHQPEGQGSSANGQQSLPSQTSPASVASGHNMSGNARASTEHDTETPDEFEDLDFDLTQSLQGS